MTSLILAKPNRRLLAHWLAARQGARLPRRAGAYFSTEPDIAPHIALEARTADGQVRIAFAGSTVTSFLGVDVTGTSSLNAFGADTSADLRNLLGQRWLTPMIMHSTNNVPTHDGALVQVEILKLPFMIKSMTALAYAIGITATAHDTATGEDTPACQHMKDRTTLLRDIYDPASMLKITSPLSIPPAHETASPLIAAAAQ